MSTGYQQLLEREKFYKIKAGLSMYRIDSFVRDIDKKQGSNKGGVLGFVRGLRLSSLLIYSIRQLLDGSTKTANWGHIIDKNGEFCSRECDIIIHKKDIPEHRWNGDGAGNNIMDFRFIPNDAAEVVISCKSYLTKDEIEADYCTDMQKFVKRVWLFAECCGPRSDDKIQAEAQKIGYEDFWFLYKWSKEKNEITEVIEQWDSFVDAIKSLR